MPIAPDGSALPYPGDTTAPPQMGGYPDSITVGGAEEEAPAGPDDKVKRIIEMASEILSDDGLDDVEKAFIAQMTVLAQKLLAARQKEKDGLMSGKSTPSALRTGLGG